MVRRIVPGLGVAAVLACAAATASADVTFTSAWEKLSNTDVNSPRVMAWDPVTNTVILPESAGSYAVHAYDGATGATLPNLSTTGLSLGGLGHFAMAASASGKVYGYNDNNGTLSVWNSVSDPTPHSEAWAGGFARNLFVAGTTIYAAGASDGGPVTINDPSPTPGAGYVLTTTVGGRAATGSPGGKSGVTANQAGTFLYGSETISGPPDDGIHVWKKDTSAGTWSYLGDIVIPGQFPATAGIPWSPDVALDETNNLLFGLDRNTDKVFAINLGDPNTVGDETYVGEYTVGSDAIYYGSLAVDPAHKRLYWMARNADASASFGVLNYSLPVTSIPGDINNDGIVNQLDLNVVVGNWQKNGAGATGGDINADGIVNQLDLNIIVGNWQKTSASDPAGVSAALASVPEPTSLAVCGLALLPLLSRRRRPAR